MLWKQLKNCFSPGSQRVAREDGCNSDYCFGALASHLWVKYLFFRIWVFCWFISWSGSVQVYNRFTRDFYGYCACLFFLKTHKVKILLIIPDHFFLSHFKEKPITCNYSTFWSSLIICSSLSNVRDSLEFNIPYLFDYKPSDFYTD